MGVLLILAFLFFIGSVAGWILELFYRRFFSSVNTERKWINPGFCVGPYLPIYGFGLCIMYLISSLENLELIHDPVISKIVFFAAMAVCMTVIEYIAGILSLKIMKVRLWDYTGEWGNIQGIICPKFSLIWALLGAVYYFLIHSRILSALDWLSDNLAFSFVIGVFFGVFAIDVVYSAQLIAKLKKFAEDNNIVVRYEHLKAHLRSAQDKSKQKFRFLFPLRTERPLREHLKEYGMIVKDHIKNIKK